MLSHIEGLAITRKAGGFLQIPDDRLTETGKGRIRPIDILMLREIFTSIEPDPLYHMLDFTQVILKHTLWSLYDEGSQTKFYIKEFSFAKKNDANGGRVVVYVVVSAKNEEEYRLYGYSIPLGQQDLYGPTAWAANPLKWQKIIP